jgi:4-hydroxy-3-methylbut-2-enyl diphosphate reductase
MLRGETEEVQRRIAVAIQRRDRETAPGANFRSFDTICGATQERQDALRDMLRTPMDLLLVVGGYNSSNTSHLAEMGQERLPTYFIRNAERLESRDRIIHYDLHQRSEISMDGWLPQTPVVVGVTAGASCPNNLIEETIVRLYELGGIPRARVLEAVRE